MLWWQAASCGVQGLQPDELCRVNSWPCWDWWRAALCIEVQMPFLSWQMEGIPCMSAVPVSRAPCWLYHFKQGLFDGKTPVFSRGIKITSRAIALHGAQLNVSTLAIVELHLEQVYKNGTPAHALHTLLQGTFLDNPENLQFFGCTFDNKSKSVESQQQNIKTLVSTLKR